MIRRLRAAAVVAALMTAVALPGSAPALAAQPVTLQAFSGTWEGAAQTPNGEVALRAAFNVQDGKLGGTIDSSMGLISIVTSAVADDKLTLTIDIQGNAATLNCKLVNGRIDGVWEVGSDTGPFYLARPGAGTTGNSAEAINGTWAGEVDIAGQLMPFSMELRVSGDTVAGEMISGAGKVPLTSGSWKDGALQLGFPYTGGEPVTMGAKLQDGKLVGVVDYNRGEATGTWTASRK